MPGFDYVTYNDVDELRTKVKDARGGLLGKGKSRLAAIMLEPLQGEGGITPATQEFFRAARELCDETGALLMADEVQTHVQLCGRRTPQPSGGATRRAAGSEAAGSGASCRERASP